MIRKVRVHGQPTIFYEDEIFIDVDSEDEIKEAGEEAYRAILEECFGWVDIDTIYVEVLD